MLRCINDYYSGIGAYKAGDIIDWPAAEGWLLQNESGYFEPYIPEEPKPEQVSRQKIIKRSTEK